MAFPKNARRARGTGAVGAGTGADPGVSGTGGPTGAGVAAIGGAISGSALTATVPVTSAAAAGTFVGGDADAKAVGPTYSGGRATIATNYYGATFTGSDNAAASNYGIVVTGGSNGATSHAIIANGGATQGAGIVATGGSNTSAGGTFTGGGGGVGINATGNGAGVGVNAVGGATGRAAVFTADTTSPVQPLMTLTPQDAQPTGANVVGDIYVTTAGVLKICTVAGTPGTWVSVGAQA